MARKFLAYVVVIIVVAMSGCGKEQPVSSSPGLLNCTPNNCKVAVTVGDCTNAATITVTPDQLPVPKGNHHIKIDWEVQSGYKWVPAPNGITFPTPPPPNEFTNPHDNGSKYDLTDENSATVPTPYKYNIHLQKDDGTLCAVKDPSIVNGS
jgi:hypothetical protein